MIFYLIEKPSLPSDEWINDSNREYPSPQTEWNGNDIVAFNALFNQEYDVNDLMPFPEFATYAFKRNEEAVLYQGIIYIRDKLATEEDMQNYINNLTTKHGFVLATEELMDGTTRQAYHKQIKNFGNGYYAYSSIYLEYDDGITIITRKYHNHKDYDNLTEINRILAANAFNELVDSANINEIIGTDYTYEYIESWANLFNYDLVFRVVLTFNKNADIEEYLDDYKELLINSGYKLDESANAYRYKTEEFENSILFNIDSTNNMVYMQFKAETFLSDEAIMNALKDSGFPTFDISSIDSTSKEVTDMYSVLYNQEHDYVYIVSLNFESVEEVNTFLDEYIINTLCNSGFESVSPEYARVPHKDFAYYNETKKLIVCFNYTNQGFISLHFIDAASDFQPNSGE